jgi:hypothetical protein
MATAPSLFGASPDMLRQQREADIQAQGEAAAGRDVYQQARYLQSVGVNRFGDALGGLLGGQDPAMQKASAMKSLAQGLDLGSSDGMAQYAKALSSQGLAQESFQASQQAQAMQMQGLEMRKATAETGTAETKQARDTGFTQAFAALPADATDEQKMQVAMQFGSQDSVLKVIEMSSNKEAARANAIAIKQADNVAKMERLQQQGADQALMQRAAQESRMQLAQMVAALKQGQGEKPLTAVQQLKQTKDTAKSTFALRAQDDDFTSLVAEGKKITESKGFAGAQGVSSVFTSMPGSAVSKTEALIEGFKSRVKKIGLDQIRVGGSIGAMTEKEWPIVEQMVANISPKAGNVKEQIDAVVSKVTQMQTNSRQLHADTYGEDSLPKMKTTPPPPSRDVSGGVRTPTGALGTAGNPIRLD